MIERELHDGDAVTYLDADDVYYVVGEDFKDNEPTVYLSRAADGEAAEWAYEHELLKLATGGGE